jgi:hypothetical protein
LVGNLLGVRSLNAVKVSAMVALLGGCGSRAVPSPSMPSSANGAVVDPAGDAVSSRLVPVSPDLTSAVVRVEHGLLTATVVFASGTLSRERTDISVLLDTDEDPATGFAVLDVSTTLSERQQDRLLGWDYVIWGPKPPGSTVAPVSRSGEPGSSVRVGEATVTYPSADEVQFETDLDVVGHDDGHMRFRVAVADVQPTPPFVGTDFMPDVGEPPGTVAVRDEDMAGRGGAR